MSSENLFRLACVLDRGSLDATRHNQEPEQAVAVHSGRKTSASARGPWAALHEGLRRIHFRIPFPVFGQRQRSL